MTATVEHAPRGLADTDMPEDIREDLVQSLYGPLGSLFIGAFCTVLVGLTVAARVDSTLLYAITAGLAVVAALRLALWWTHRRTAVPDAGPQATRRWEVLYAIGAWSFSAGLGALALSGFAVTDDAVVHLLVNATATGYAAGVTSRNAVRPMIARGQLMLSILPGLAGMVLQGGLAYYVLALITVLYVIANSELVRLLYTSTTNLRLVNREKSALADALSEQNARFDAALENMSHGLCMFDGRQRLVVWNHRVLELLRLPPQAVHYGMPLTDLVSEGIAQGNWSGRDIAEAQRDYAARARSGKAGLVRLPLTDGRILQLSYEPMPDGGTVVTLTDVTIRERERRELKAAKEAAEAANQAKSQFLTSMSHELRTPLNAIIGFAEVIGEEILGPTGNPTYRNYARDIRASGHHLLELINDLLDSAKIETGKIALHDERVTLGPVVDEVTRLARASTREDTAPVETDCTAPSLVLTADRKALKQILLNLLTNAVKFTPPDGRIRLRQWQEAEWLCLEVSDTGIGIPEDRIADIGERFVQVENALSRRHHGSGLGLYITKSLTELMGGDLHVDSVEGEGTRVLVRLPAWRVRAVASPGPT